MSDLGWRADGIERAIAVGGIPLDLYRRPGFTGGTAVRRADLTGGGYGASLDTSTSFVDEPPLCSGGPSDGLRLPLPLKDLSVVRDS